MYDVAVGKMSSQSRKDDRRNARTPAADGCRGESVHGKSITGQAPPHLRSQPLSSRHDVMMHHHSRFFAGILVLDLYLSMLEPTVPMLEHSSPLRRARCFSGQCLVQREHSRIWIIPNQRSTRASGCRSTGVQNPMQPCKLGKCRRMKLSWDGLPILGNPEGKNEGNMSTLKRRWRSALLLRVDRVVKGAVWTLYHRAHIAKSAMHGCGLVLMEIDDDDDDDDEGLEGENTRQWNYPE
ncbi:hypothetical protein B0T13DRAFT_231002 [Neurospora crassa]|nr:hypothetical protein B0T13DRAFT_231002 [Neurospora crassa]